MCIHCVYIVSPWTDWMRMGQPWDVSIPDVGQGFSQWREGSGRDSKIEIVRAAALVLELWSYCPHPRNSLASVSLSTTFFLSTFSPKLALFPNNRRSFTKFNHWKSCAGEDDSEYNFYQHSLSCLVINFSNYYWYWLIRKMVANMRKIFLKNINIIYCSVIPELKKLNG